MIINKLRTEKCLNLVISGKVDNKTCHQFLEVLMDSLHKNTRTVLDCTELEYMNSAGLRALLQGMQKAEEVGAELIVKKVNEEIAELFSITGFDQMLNIIL